MTGEMTRLVLLANVALTLLLVGLIWFVQVVHYPEFALFVLNQMSAGRLAHGQ